MKLTIAYITARKQPHFKWFLESLATQIMPRDDIQIVIIDFFAQPCDYWQLTDVAIRQLQLGKLIEDVTGLVPACLWSQVEKNSMWCPPMPTVWQGPSRLTKENWWAKSAALNTALCYAKGEWFLHLDDRCVLAPGFMDAVREHMQSRKMVFGSFEKRSNLVVEKGLIKDKGELLRKDHRADYARQIGINPIVCEGHWYFGCCGMGPTEWYLDVNGWDMTCDGLSYEDVMLGRCLENNGDPLLFDSRMLVIQDRTPGRLDPVFLREDKGVAPDTKSAALNEKLKEQKRALHSLDLRVVRQDILAGKPFPPAVEPQMDWFDGQPLKDFKSTTQK